MNQIILPALYPTDQAVFETDVSRVPDEQGGRPKYVLLRPIRTAGNQVRMEDITEYIATQMKRLVYRYVGEYSPFIVHPRSRQWIDDNVQGTIQMRNIEDHGRAAHARDVLVGNIDVFAIDELFELATQQGSNPDLDFYQVEWSFLIHANTIEGGAGKGWKNFKDLKGLANYDWPHDDPMPCGIIALVQGYFKQARNINLTGKRISKGKKSEFENECRRIKFEEIGNFDPKGMCAINYSN